MKQRKLIDVSLMGIDYSGVPRPSTTSALSNRPNSSRLRRRNTSARSVASKHRHNSPSERSVSSKYHHNSPSERSVSSKYHHNSPSERSVSSKYRQNSPSERSVSSKYRQNSPSERSVSSKYRQNSPSERSVSSKYRHNSPSERSVSSKYRHNSPSERSVITTITLDQDTKSSSTPKSSGYPASHSSIPLLSVNGKSVDSCATSRGSSRVTSGVSRMTLSSSGGRRRCRSAMSSTARSSVTGYSSVVFPDFIGSQPALTVWTLESGHLRQVAVSDHGFFHEGNVYLILKIKTDGSSFLHIWCGIISSENERCAIQEHANQLDRIIQGANVFSLERQGHETPLILQHFNSGIVVVEGKSRSLLSKAWRYSQRLYLVEGRHKPTATCMKCWKSALASNRALILDGFPRIYVWLGEDTDHNTKVKAIKIATALRTWQRNGIAHIIVIEKSDTALHGAFVQKLDQDEDEKTPEESGMELRDTEPHQERLNLYRVNGERVMYDMPFVAKKPLQHKYLTSKDCFLVDQGPSYPVCIWVGSTADSYTLHAAIQRAQNFSHHHNYPTTTPICRLMEGSEPLSFKAAFNNWMDRMVKERQLVRTYNVANIGRALFSSTDCRTISQVTELWSDDELLKNDNGKTEVFRIDDDHLTPLMWEQRGVFHNWQCYIVLYKDLSGYGETHVLYYWLGSKSSQEQRDKALELVLSMSSDYRHQAFVMRVLDSKETKHFMSVLQNSMVVYDADIHRDDDSAEACKNDWCLSSVRDDDSAEACKNDWCLSSLRDDGSEADDDVKMFCIQEFLSGCMRVSQVAPRTSSLNSSAAFVVFSASTAFVWYGKNSSANEREYSKNMLSYFCPDRTHQFDIINEKKEPSKFYCSVAQDGSYPAEFFRHVIHRRPPRLALYSDEDKSFSFYDRFSQEDLNEADIFILDTFDQLQIWNGSSTLNRNDTSLLSIVQVYLDQDLAGRCMDDIHICFVAQGSEPDIFVKYFPSWDKYGYSGQIALDATRKRTRQENAAINIDAQMVDPTYTSMSKVPFKQLVKGSDSDGDINRHHREHHLTDKEFTRALRMTRAEFYRLPLWKQRQILSSARLVDQDSTMEMYSDRQSQLDLDLIKYVKNCNKVSV